MYNDIIKERKKTINIVQSLLVVVAIVFGITGIKQQSMNIFFLSIFFIYINNVIFVLRRWSESFILGFFYVTFFTFLLSRPFIGICRGKDWWNSALQAEENIWFALILLLISIIGLFVGSRLIGYYDRKKNKVEKLKKNKTDKKYPYVIFLQQISCCVFFITICFYLIEQLEPLWVIGMGDYLQYYTEYHSKLPSFFHTIASFHKYSLCIFLATLPNKKKAFIPLALFELSAIPSFLVGVRNPIMLNSLFILVYYLLRDNIRNETEKKWLGKIECSIVVISTPVILIFMGCYSYIRDGQGMNMVNPIRLLVDFFEGQGVTFDVMTIAYGYRAGILLKEPKNYTFGSIIDYIYRGTVGQKIFGTCAIPEGNNEIAGTLSNNFSHILSYITLKDEYLNGRGRGSSYILEVFFDYGYIGVFIFNIILCIVLIGMVRWFGKKVLFSTIILISLTGIFFIPRAEATGWLTFIVTLQFWMCVGICYLGAFLCERYKWMQKVMRLLHIYPKEVDLYFDS